MPASAATDQERLTALHNECEEAYLINDFTRMEETIEEREKILFANEEFFARYVFNTHLAILYKDIGSLHYCLADIEGSSYDEAFIYYYKSLDLYQSALKDSNGEAILRTELAQLHYKTGEYSKALEHLKTNRRHYMQSGLERMELETWSQIALCKARMGLYDEALADIDSTILLAGRHSVPSERLRKKGKILVLRSEAENTPATEAVDYFRQYFELQRDSISTRFKDMTASQRESYWLRMQPFITDCFRLEGEAPELLYNMVLFSKSILLQFSQNKPAAVAPSWTEIQKKLPKDGCAIEYVQYEKYGDLYLGALILHAEGKPEFIRLFKLNDLLEYRLPGEISVKEAVSEENHAFKDALYTCDALDQIIWPARLRRSIKGAETVFFAADGILHRLGIEYMFPQRKSPEFIRLTSTRELLREGCTEIPEGMLLCGGIDHYNVSSEADSSSNDKLAYQILARKRIRFSNLKGAGEEVRMIKDIRNNPSDTLITAGDAEEEALLALMNNYGIVTIATHGYYGGDSQRCGTDLKTWKSDEKLSQSVLLVSGAQANMSNAGFNPDMKDGIISARELSQTDLSNVHLFILSACQSGLGEITGDGVFGLQRGLKNAGVTAMIVSLWEVDDEATCFFMTRFHTALAAGKQISEAFRIARDSMDKKISVNGEKKDFSKPRYRNAFILIDSL